jgi:hypothetical protein
VNDAISRRALLEQRSPTGVRGIDACAEPVAIYRDWLALVKDPYADRGFRIVEADCEEAIVFVEQDGEITGDSFAPDCRP